MAKFVWKRASKKAKTSSSKRRMKALRMQAYTPYSSIRGTNPVNQTTFKGKGFPDRLTTNVVYSDSFILDPSAVTPTPYKTYLLTSGFDPDNALAVANLRIGINSLQCILATRLMAQRLQPRLASLLRMLLTRVHISAVSSVVIKLHFLLRTLAF